MDKFIKQPSEAIRYSVDFCNALPKGSAIAEGEALAFDLANGSGISSSLLDSDTVEVVGTKLFVRVKGGVDGLRAKITFRVTLNDHVTKPTILEEDVHCFVREL